MWNTPAGDRKLAGKERAVFVEGLYELLTLLQEDVEIVEDGGHPSWGEDVCLFAAIPVKRRPWALLAGCQDLLSDGTPVTPAYWQEATVLSVFYHLEGMIQVEIDMEKEDPDPALATRWRRGLLEAWLERCYDPEEDEIDWDGERGPLQKVTSTDTEEWIDKVYALAGEVLWDWDVELTQFYNLAAELQKCPNFTEHEEARLDKFREQLIAELKAQGAF